LIIAGELQQLNSLSLRRSEMFIARNIFRRISFC